MSEENSYNYPIDTEHWNTEEIINVVHFYQLVEKMYEQGVEKEDFLSAYRRFKQIIPSKSEEKALDKQFAQQSGYSIYKAVQEAKNSSAQAIVSLK
ncbi:UPF0223 family protein [Pontibacillus litoralis]|uniref:Uncharacterized protein n=1 Tax=Pontibacillus litoralis JSM 072002 TaxID=1385512 RepID=A0A0A5GC48_9BACI|nr:UPF0223 family protein [Pontibacillus litoralis]KGX88778.1 hypothetical protein N784_00050 [Pontibacillus litoralis JSM 072002]